MNLNFISFDFRLIVATSKRVEDWKKDFRKKLVKTIFNIKGDVNEVGLESTIAFNSREIQLISKNKISNIFSNAIYLHNNIYACVVDFFNTEEYDRRSILDDIIDELKKIFNAQIATRFIIILPDKTFPNASYFNQLLPLADSISAGDIELYIIINNGTCAKISTIDEGKKNVINLSLIEPLKRRSQIINIFKKVNDAMYEEQLKFRCIRRVGHFQVKRAGKIINFCKPYSYLFYNCDDVFKHLLMNLWKVKKINCDSVIYDSKSNISFKEAIESLCVDKDIYCDRIDDILKYEDLEYIYRRKSSPIIVVDVIDTGQTVEYYYNKLKEKGINVSNSIIAALDKSGVAPPRIVNKLEVYSLLQKSNVPEYNKEMCEQCILDLPYINEEYENYYTVRAYDLLKIICETKEFVQETDKPKMEIGYRLIPKYSQILESHGLWIAYKINEYMKKNSVPADTFIIRPQEPESRQITSGIQRIRDMKPMIIEIPREGGLDIAESSKEGWTKIIETQKDLDWVFKLIELSKVKGNRAVIVDIFKSRGSTCKSLKALLDCLDIKCLGAYSFIDYQPDEQYYPDVDLMTYSLYHWYYPR